MATSLTAPHIAIACGGTGGHLFPGLAVAQELQARGCKLTLLISPKEVDQQAVKTVTGMALVTLPAVALQHGDLRAFLRGFWQSYQLAKKLFAGQPPHAVLAMGGFMSAPPVLAAKRFRAATYLHEANSIPGRANRWLAPWVDEVFTYFPDAARRLRNPAIRVTGLPVRSEFQPMDAAACRQALGLDPQRPVLLVLGGSQGARAINKLIMQALGGLGPQAPHLQFLHLTGTVDADEVRTAYAAATRRAVVRPFLTEMELALGAATLAVSRAGASSLAEFAAMRLPAILIPYPHAADDHQFHNARAFAVTGAARLVGQNIATPETIANLIVELLHQPAAQAQLRAGLAAWHKPEAAQQIAQRILPAPGELTAPTPPNFSQREKSANAPGFNSVPRQFLTP